MSTEFKAIILPTLLALVAFGLGLAVWISSGVSNQVAFQPTAHGVKKVYLPAIPSDTEVLSVVLPGVYTIGNWGHLVDWLKLESIFTDIALVLPFSNILLKVTGKIGNEKVQ